MTIRYDVNSILVLRDSFLEVTQLPKAPETSFEGITKVVQMAQFVRVTIRSEVICIPVAQEGMLEVIQLSEALEMSEEGGAKAI